MLARSARGFSPSISLISLSILTLSPVSADSFTWTDAHSISLPSAHIWSPASIRRMSPTAISSEGIMTFSPLRSALAVGAESFLRFVSDFSALTVWTVPKIAFIVITTRITAQLSTSFMKAETIAAIMSISTRKSLYCSKKITGMDFFLPSVITFRPNFSQFFTACSVERPFSPDENSV